MKQVISRSLLLLVVVCFFVVFTGIRSNACDKTQLTKYVMNSNKTRQINNAKVDYPAELTDFIFANSLLRF